MKKRQKQLIGRTDKLDFPDFEFENIPCKIDTGAATSSIHCEHVFIREKDGHEVLVVEFKDPNHPGKGTQTHVFTEFREKKITSSSGHAEYRYIIQTPMVIFGQTHLVEVSLADRDAMRYPVLLGRKALSREFIVDVSKTNLSFKSKSKK